MECPDEFLGGYVSHDVLAIFKEFWNKLNMESPKVQRSASASSRFTDYILLRMLPTD